MRVARTIPCWTRRAWANTAPNLVTTPGASGGDPYAYRPDPHALEPRDPFVELFEGHDAPAPE
jgi:hypothetical protein